ncbi:YXWGXW repeat-containing protein [Allostella humosa]|nr:YXWGXW repeat-containing protein [Stella humosa]
MRGLLAAVLLAAPLATAGAAPHAVPAAQDHAKAIKAEQVQFRQDDARRGPPPPRRERMGRPPGPRDQYVWRKGYYVRDGGQYAWRPGEFVQKPRPRAVWVGDRWVRRGGEWTYIEGRWR